MGLFNSKHKQSVPNQTSEVETLFDDDYRRALRRAGIEHFKKLIESNAAALKADIDASSADIKTELTDYMRRQLDSTLASLNKQISEQLDARLEDFNRLNTETQTQAAESLSRSAAAVYEKYQKFNSTLQQSITSQEVMMISVFQDNKARVVASQNQQDKALAELNEATRLAQQKSSELNLALEQSIQSQDQKLNQIYAQNLERVEATAQAQEKALVNLRQSSEALEQKYQQLSDLVDKSVADQKAMLVSSINDNMARIIEHYLLAALGEQSDLRSQLPSILEQMEQNKQAMVEDMKL